MFQYYGTIDYKTEKIQDITTRYIISAKTTTTGYPAIVDYIIKDWKSPENIAYDLYGSCDYVWIILLCNNIVNPFEDWLRTNEEMELYINAKYGDKKDDINHYELDGIIYWNPIPNAVAVTNSQYEYDRNEKKRKIQVLLPEAISVIEDLIANT